MQAVINTSANKINAVFTVLKPMQLKSFNHIYSFSVPNWPKYLEKIRI